MFLIDASKMMMEMLEMPCDAMMIDVVLQHYLMSRLNAECF